MIILVINVVCKIVIGFYESSEIRVLAGSRTFRGTLIIRNLHPAVSNRPVCSVDPKIGASVSVIKVNFVAF